MGIIALMKFGKLFRFIFCFLLIFVFLLAACQDQNETALPTPLIVSTITKNPSAGPTSTPTSVPTPTQTPIPAAAIVNDEIIPLTYFAHEVQRYKASYSENETLPSDEEISQQVLDFLVEQQLLSQAARASGYTFTDQMMEEKISDLLAQLGSGSALTNWMQANFYDDAEFRMALRLGSEAAWQRDQIAASVPEAVEQVHARQIFTLTEEAANDALANLNAGISFDELAWKYSPETGGELGWFPRGYLLFPEIEAAAFSLPVGEHSGIIQSQIGYHIILVVAHEDTYPLTTDARLSLQSKALDDWLQAQRAQAQIEITLP